MADAAASVLARLKNKAAQSGRSYQLCLQLFCQEEFLRRLEKSKYAENLVLKGGLFIYSLTDFDSRVTVDVDFLLRQIPNTPEQLKSILEEIAAISTGNDFVNFEIKNVAPISVAKKYAGIGASVVAHIKNTRTPFGIDFGVGDVIVPKTEKRKIPTQLSDFDAPTVNTYSIETTVAEKLDAILSLMEFSSRMKDYYDIYYLANKFDFDGRVLTEALRKTFVNRERSFTAEQFERVMNFDKDAAMQKKWKAFARKIDAEMMDFGTVLGTIKAFLEKPFTAAIEGGECAGQWSAGRLRHLVREAMAYAIAQIEMDMPQKSYYEFHMPQSCLFTYNGDLKTQLEYKKNVYQGYLSSAAPRSMPEVKFEKFCERADSVEWWYKNGDKGNEYLSIVYQDNSGKQKLFYPDYIVGVNGEIWIIETKGGFDRNGNSQDIDKYTAKKFDVLKTYLDKHGLKGGIVRNDDSTDELCICMDNYSDDIRSDDWTILSEMIM